MTDINVDDFFNDAARALVLLYQVFPRRKPVYVEDISGQEEPDEFGMHSERYRACFGTLLWLGEEGLLRYEQTINSDAIDQAVLTARCFALLSNPQVATVRSATDLPESIALERSSLIYRLQSAVRDRSSMEVRLTMQQLLTAMAGLPWTVNPAGS
jgi:hypothetical protein